MYFCDAFWKHRRPIPHPLIRVMYVKGEGIAHHVTEYVIADLPIYT